MKWLILALLVLLGAVSISLLVREDPGYVLMAYGPWTLEMSLALFVVLAVLALVAFYLVLRSLVGMWHLPRRVRRWRQQRQMRRARRSLTRGLIQLAEGRWATAEETLVKHAKDSETPLLNYIAAARAAQQQGAHERRDHYLRLAHESTAGADIAVGLSQAESQLAHQQLEQALATLRHLRQLAPHHAYVLKLLMKVYRELRDWQALRDLLPELRKRRVLEEDALQQLERQVYRTLLAEAAETGRPETLIAQWQEVPRHLRRDEDVVRDYVARLMAAGAGEEAAAQIHQYLKRHWSDDLVRLYGDVHTNDPGRRLKEMEEWLERRPRNPTLLLAAGRTAKEAELWGKARQFLEASLAAEATPAAAWELGQLLEQLDDHAAALGAYRQAARLAVAPGTPLQIGKEESGSGEAAQLPQVAAR